MSCRFVTSWISAGVAVLLPALANADSTHVAVAANFTHAAIEIAGRFEEETGHIAVLSFGSTGQLYAQISQGAPFEVFLAADGERPALAIGEGYAVENTSFTYAVGRLALWSADAGLVAGPETLHAGTFDRIAIANPETAPYGAAALEVMRGLGVYETLSGKLVRGNNIAQTYQFVETGNAEIGFVSLSQIVGHADGSRWVVPTEFHAPIRQDAVLLNAGENRAAAKAFLDFLKSPVAVALIGQYGYAAEGNR